MKAEWFRSSLLTSDVQSALCLLGSILVDDLADIRSCVWPLSWGNSDFDCAVVCLPHGKAPRCLHCHSVLWPGSIESGRQIFGVLNVGNKRWRSAEIITVGVFNGVTWQRSLPINKRLPADLRGDDSLLTLSYHLVTWFHLLLGCRQTKQGILIFKLTKGILTID